MIIYLTQRVGFDFSDIKIMSKSEQRDVIMKLRLRDLKKQRSNNILLAENTSQKQTVIQTILHFVAGPFNDSLQLFGSAKKVLIS